MISPCTRTVRAGSVFNHVMHMHFQEQLLWSELRVHACPGIKREGTSGNCLWSPLAVHLTHTAVSLARQLDIDLAAMNFDLRIMATHISFVADVTCTSGNKLRRALCIVDSNSDMPVSCPIFFLFVDRVVIHHQFIWKLVPVVGWTCRIRGWSRRTVSKWPHRLRWTTWKPQQVFNTNLCWKLHSCKWVITTQL